MAHVSLGAAIIFKDVSLMGLSESRLSVQGGVYYLHHLVSSSNQYLTPLSLIYRVVSWGLSRGQTVISNVTLIYPL